MSAGYSNNIWLVFIGISIAILSIAILSNSYAKIVLTSSSPFLIASVLGLVICCNSTGTR